jgi:hypothetical protein
MGIIGAALYNANQPAQQQRAEQAHSHPHKSKHGPSRHREEEAVPAQQDTPAVSDGDHEAGNGPAVPAPKQDGVAPPTNPVGLAVNDNDVVVGLALVGVGQNPRPFV